MRSRFLYFLVGVLLLAGIAVCQGCETVNGMKKDLSSLGHATADGVEQGKDGLAEGVDNASKKIHEWDAWMKKNWW